ncbi:MAG: hypothetical protein WC683_07640 [bacterium]
MSVLYTLDANYSALTEAEAAELVPVLGLGSGYLKAGMVVRGKLAGKVSKAEGPATARFMVVISPRNWAASHVYAVGDRATNDDLKEYICTAAGTSDSSGGPTGNGDEITDSGVTWGYVRQAPVLIDTHEISLAEGEYTDAPWMLEFELHVRLSRDTGSTYHQWHPTVVSTAQLRSPVIPAALLLPAEGTYPVIVETDEDNVLHVLYQPELETGSITCMTYVLEVL